MKRPLTWKEQDMIEQVKATFAIEDIYLSQREIDDMESILRGEETVEEVIERIFKEEGV